jgi:hypothetical protein
MVHRRRRREGLRGGRSGIEGEGVVGEVSRSPEQGRRGELKAVANRIGRERERQRD